MRHNKDILWKGLLEWVFDDLLRFLFPDADQRFDLQRGFSFMDKELAGLYLGLEDSSNTRFVDKLVKVFHKDGSEECMFIHIEIQDKTKPAERMEFPERMFRYFYRCFDHYKKPVASIAIFTGPDAKQMPDKYTYECMNTRLEYRYNAIRISDYSNEELAESNNPFALALLIAKQALQKGKDLDKKLLEGKLLAFRKIFKDNDFERKKLEALLEFLYRYIRFEKVETNKAFKNKIDHIIGKKISMTVLEALKILDRNLDPVIRRNERERTARIMLRHTKYSPGKIAKIVGINVAVVKKIKAKMSAKKRLPLT